MNTDSFSLCPECFARIRLEYVRDGEKVTQRKVCPEHGVFENVIWNGKTDFTEWTRIPELSPPPTVMTGTINGCPFDCGICPEHRQQACCVVLEVTERCNQKCPVCYASSGGVSEDPSTDEIMGDLEFLRGAGESRPFNLQFSGGEPTIRDDLPVLLKAALEMGFPYLQLNTNGRRLADEDGYAEELKDSGLSSVFLQFDGLSDQIYLKLRGEVLLDAKIRAVENCARAGLAVVLVVTLTAGINDGQLGELVSFVTENLPHVRGLHIQPMSFFGRYPDLDPANRITMPEVFAAFESQTKGAISAGSFRPLSTGHPLCSFFGRYYIDEKGSLLQLPQQPEKGCCCGNPSPSAAIIRARDFLAENWTLDEAGGRVKAAGAEFDMSAWDEYVKRIKNNGFSITGMLFQDAESLDLERLSACRVHVLAPGRRLIPFCAYNLTDRSGRNLYRNQEALIDK